MAALLTRLGPHFSEGSRLLWKLCDSPGFSQMRVERELPAPAGIVSRWMRGDRRPRPKNKSLLEDRYGIPILSWGQKPKRALRPARPATERLAA